MTLTDPLIATLAVPAVLTIALALILRLIGGAGAGARIASFGLPVAVVVSIAILPGLSPTPPVSALEKLVWLAAVGGLLGVLIDLVTQARLIAGIVAFVWPLLAVLWLSGIDLDTAADSALYRVGEASVVAGLFLARLHQIGDTNLNGPIVTAVIAAGLGVLAMVTGPGYGATLGVPMAAAGFGWLVCNWPNRRLPFGAAGEIGAGGVTLALAAVMVHQGKVPVVLVLLVLSAVLVEPLARRFVAASPLTKAEAVQPIALAVLTALPAALAVLLAMYAPALVPRIYQP